MGKQGRWVAGLVVAVAMLPASASADVPGYPAVMATFDIDESQQAAQTADCPGGGDMAISGGTYNGAPIGEKLWLKSTRPGSVGDPSAKTAWTVEVQNVFDPFPTTYPDAQAWVICDEGGLGDYKVRRKLDIKVRNERQVTAFPKCRDSEAVVGGGADVSGEIGDAVHLSSSYPRDDGDRGKAPDGWSVAAEAAGIDSPTTMDAYVVCDKKRRPSRYHYKSEPAEVADGEQQSASAACDILDERRVGGGVRSGARFNHQLRINTSAPTGDTGWEAFVDNFADPKDPDGVARTITVTAICLKS